VRAAWKGIYVANGGYDAERGERAVSDGSADAVAYGRLFLANPDLPTRLSRRGPLNVPDTGSFYGGDERGYIDYPEWAKSGTGPVSKSAGSVVECAPPCAGSYDYRIARQNPSVLCGAAQIINQTPRRIPLRCTAAAPRLLLPMR
jgi:hypothetical protein